MNYEEFYAHSQGYVGDNDLILPAKDRFSLDLTAFLRSQTTCDASIADLLHDRLPAIGLLGIDFDDMSQFRTRE
jgi:hypothetical protein